MNTNFVIKVADHTHHQFVPALCELYEISARERGTGIARRSPEYLREKMMEEKAIIALTTSGTLAGFCYVETWSHAQYVANSGLIVLEQFRGQGLARAIKMKAFRHARDSYPNAKVFGITTSLAVMQINSDLGYRPVTFSELTQDEAFWNGCQTCPNYDILQRNQRKHCLCTGMLAPAKIDLPVTDSSNHQQSHKL